ncbi:MAG: sigma 54-interacting transcriptional regulator [Deltaproteobacteria bacterium]|nr:sigma 54-interacting transcriptional regulator [Deltaproteobacteria bacterium]
MVEPDPATSECRLYGQILESIGEAVFTVDLEWRVTSFNAAAERLVGLDRSEAIGMRCRDVFRADVCHGRCPLKGTLEGGPPARDLRVTVLDRHMREVPVTISTAALRDASGRVVGGVEILRDISDVEALRRELHGQAIFEDIVGRSPPMRELFRVLPDVARSGATVLLQGPSGTGKELVARAIHRLSPRADRPFVQINCAALPDTLLESELFGHRKGAFTDAREDAPGRFAVADGGTLFLDEIAETSPSFQVKLLRAVQDGEIQPLGDRVARKVDVRLVAATNRDLSEMVRQRTFREDLYYRLRVVALDLPPLCDRREDIPLLAEHLLERVAIRRGRPVMGISPAALRVLYDYPFPGNVRELENAIERAVALTSGPSIQVGDLPPEIARWQPTRDPTSSERAFLAHAVEVDDVDLLAALEAHRWNRQDTARALGISRVTLWRRMKTAGLIP